MDHFHLHHQQEASQHLPDSSQREAPWRVLIVDDHEIFRHGLRDLINRIEGFQVVAEAGSSAGALAAAESTSPEVIFMDLSLPDVSGLSIIHQLKQSSAHPAIIVLSATMTDDTLVEAMLSGADGYLTKDIPAVEIINILLNFLQGAPAMLPSVANNLIHQLVKRCNDLLWYSDSLEAQVITKDLNSATSQEPLLLPLSPSGKPVFISSSAPALQTLTPQEERVFQLMCQGQSNKDIATQLSISHYTVGKHVQNILRKLHVKNRTQAASYTSFEGGKSAGND
jgi:DNA-binding NarL/FixJ family response regulator